jgi:signal transduction histidine kinase
VTIFFEVIDTGMGINKEDQVGLFTAFQQVNSKRTRQQGGTGLGLAISMRLVRLMGGDMVVTSEGAGHGGAVQVEFSLPIA